VSHHLKTLILSIHIPCRHSDAWRRLQAQFIAETTGEYEYGVIVNGEDPAKYSNVIASIPRKAPHLQGILLAVNLFAQHYNRFTHFLLLDSDCWPIRADWQTTLQKMMGHQYHCAAPMRTENFDNFPHPCAFFMRREFLERADFGFNRAANILGIDVSDVGAAMPTRTDRRQIWHPLLKTNFIAHHPVYASVYGDLFYHHCAGSRGLGFRAANYRFYNHILTRRDHRQIYESVTAQLLNSPRKFIDGIRGVGSRATYGAVR
jgi:hypothetical protein